MLIEAIRSLRARIGLTVATLVISATAAAALVGTVGQSRAELDSLTQSFTRAGVAVVRVHAAGETALPLETCAVLAQTLTVRRAFALSASRDVFPPALTGSTVRAPLRAGTPCVREGRLGRSLGIADDTVAAGTGANRALQFATVVGPVTDGTGRPVIIRRVSDYRDGLQFLDSVVVAAEDGADGTWVEYVFELEDAALIPDFTALVTSTIGEAALDARVTSPAELAVLRSALLAERVSESRVRLLVGLLAVTLLVAAVGLIGSVFRRREMGRRRVLGASQAWLIALVALETTIAAGVGAVAGVATTLAYLWQGGAPLPDARSIISLSTCTILAATAGAVIPAVFSARADPARALRVP